MKISSSLFAIITLISSAASAQSLEPDCTTLPNFAATIGSKTSTTTFVSAIVPEGTSAIGVYTYTPTTLAHAGPYIWSVDSTGSVTVAGAGFGTATSIAPVTSIAISNSSSTATAMTINGVANAFTFQGMTTSGTTSVAWNGGLTGIDSDGAQEMIFYGYNGAAVGGSSSKSFTAYGECTGLSVSFAQVPLVAKNAPPNCSFSANTGAGSASEYTFLVDGVVFGYASVPYLQYQCAAIVAGPHVAEVIATDSAGHTVVSVPLDFDEPAVTVCVGGPTHKCPR